MKKLIQWIRQTDSGKLVAVLRILAGVPLLLLGVLHLIDPESFGRLLEASGIPFVGLNLIAAPVTEVVAGLLLVTGYLARLGGLAGALTMIAATWATAALSGMDGAPEVPPMPAPLAILAISAYVVWRGAGGWSFDHHASQPELTGQIGQVAAAPRKVA